MHSKIWPAAYKSDRVPTYGIENITEEDMAYAKVMEQK